VMLQMEELAKKLHDELEWEQVCRPAIVSDICQHSH
jgi:hypothetical protein